MARRPVAVVAALVLLVEAIGIVVINGILATFLEKQSMSLADLDPDATCLLYTSPSPRDLSTSRMPSSA